MNQDFDMKEEGCGVLFMLENGSGLIICGQKRADGNCFLCKRCLKEKSGETNQKGVELK